MEDYIIATTKTWNLAQFEAARQRLPGRWTLFTSPDDLTFEVLNNLKPRYIFFPHWSWIVPKDIVDNFECVLFHMTDLPFGRGGSPLQNLIVRGNTSTKLTALRMTTELDAGPIYLKSELSLEGRAKDIFVRASAMCFDMIEDIVTQQPEPYPQSGQVTVFNRRTPAESSLPLTGTIQGLFDHIRMLDAPSYPNAYLEYGDWKIEFTDSVISDQGSLKARVTISRK
ncbi:MULTISPECIES: formyltransferase family protein [Thalassospira]|uniref:Methionyl-tRNA formyltransferase n=2 Tax=Thalassospira TaxID=168934 RepID=A0A367WBP0_9PROT|nr:MULTISPECIES: formyltransferase family protein [Thalassospira]MDG4717676.1 hypothetical protein [Thalassospira sp. FZY0004]RCK38865.1 methionyl-tRNA formyltransferase [Thalassospira profundimaris]